MGVKISREVLFGSGSRGFLFKNHRDRAEDRRQYEQGRTLEAGRFRPGSLAQRVFAVLSNPTSSEQPSTPADETQVAESSGGKSRRPAA